MTPKEIIETICKENNLTQRELSNLLGIKEQYLYDAKYGKVKKLSKKVISQITRLFPKYNTTWLMTGMGDITVTHPSAPVFNNHGDNVQNEQNVISKDFIELIKSTIAQTDRAMNQTDKMIAIAEKAMDSLQAALDQLKKQ
ncbi:MAG: hypothetical protein UH084_08390 [Paludibacteraceae bacterium]|nr:hypothetical protein [Paludibacteraceae bacterium]